MSGPVHLLLALGYTVVAIAVALTLPYSVDGVSRPTALLTGGMVFLFGALLHEVAARQQRDKALARWLARLRSGDEALATGLDHLAAELRALREGRPVERVADRPPERAEAPTTASVEPALVAQAASRAVEKESLISQLRSMRGLFSRFRAAEPAMAGIQDPALAPNVEASVETGPDPYPGIEGSDDDAAIAEALNATLTGESVQVFFQPVLTLPQRKPIFLTVYPRLRLRDGREVPPEAYLPVARREHLVAFVDNLLLFRCLQIIRDAERRRQASAIFCAISADALADGAFFQQFRQLYAENPSLAGRLVFSLSQAELLEGNPAIDASRRALADLGFRFAMTDVAHLDFDASDLAARNVRFVILDAELVQDDIGPLGGLEAVLALKHELDRRSIDLIVSGIATEQQLIELLDLHLDFGQGPLFGDPRPLP